MNHIISIDQFSVKLIDHIFSVADQMTTGHYKLVDSTSSEIFGGNPVVYDIPIQNLMRDKVITNLFYEPSTRTSSSFYAAMSRLGGSIIPINEVSYSSVAKGETLEDTIQTLAQYSDAIVLRHNIIGSAQRAAEVSSVPIINAGDGSGEHPTQALLDLYTIISELPFTPDHITLMGDLKYGRTVHSLVKLVKLYWPETKIATVSPPQLKMPEEYKVDEIYDNLSEVIDRTDVLYMTRVQKERLLNTDATIDITNYGITLADMEKAQSHMMLMHPFPRVGEIPTSIDSDPRAKYFKQIKNGMYVRMALLYLVMSENNLFDIN